MDGPDELVGPVNLGKPGGELGRFELAEAVKELTGLGL
jgi:hypothetical protein